MVLRIKGKRKGGNTHAVEAPCVLQLIETPFCCYRLGLFGAKVRRQLVGDGFGGEEGAICVEGEDCFFA